ncbi:DNA polymerase subunit Cdc27 [Syncephalis plumigaleata]|nr:DNA polymerase subunit Cdc27 [Syncephalis plumigaleata]
MLDDPMEVEDSLTTSALNLLETWVVEEQRPVTFGMLATELSLNVNLAKRLLYTFIETEKSRQRDMNGIDVEDRKGISCLYCISGWSTKAALPPSVSSNSNNHTGGHVVRLVNEAQLNDVKAQLDKVTGIHIYAVVPGPVKDMDSIASSVIAYQKTRSKDKTVHVPFVEKAAGIVRKSHVEREPTQQSATKSTTVQKKPNSTTQVTRTFTDASSSSSPSLSSTPVTNKSNTSTTKSTSRDPRHFFAGHSNKPPVKASKQQESKIATSTTTSINKESKKKENKGMDSTQKSRKRRVINEDSDEDDDFVAPAEEKPKANIPLNDLFDTEMADSSVASATSIDNNKESAMETEGDTADAVPVEETTTPAASTKDEKRKRGRRRVTRRKTFKNERGYMVTEEVEEWESYSEDDSNGTPATTSTRPLHSGSKSKTSTTSSKPATTTGSGQQRSLLSFFKK